MGADFWELSRALKNQLSRALLRALDSKISQETFESSQELSWELKNLSRALNSIFESSQELSILKRALNSIFESSQKSSQFKRALNSRALKNWIESSFESSHELKFWELSRAFESSRELFELLRAFESSWDFWELSRALLSAQKSLKSSQFREVNSTRALKSSLESSWFKNQLSRVGWEVNSDANNHKVHIHILKPPLSLWVVSFVRLFCGSLLINVCLFKVHTCVCMCACVRACVRACVNTLQYTVMQHAAFERRRRDTRHTLQHTATRCNTLQHTATRCSTLPTSDDVGIHASRHDRAHKHELQHILRRQRVAACCSVLQRVAVWCSVMQYVAVCCSVWCTLRRILQSWQYNHFLSKIEPDPQGMPHAATRCNIPQHTATHCNLLPTFSAYMPSGYLTLQHTATHCNKLQHTATHCSTLQHTATHCNTLQHTATHCNKLPTLSAYMPWGSLIPETKSRSTKPIPSKSCRNWRRISFIISSVLPGGTKN